MTFYGRSEELVSRCIECDLVEQESLASLGGSASGLVDGILSKWIGQYLKGTPNEGITLHPNMQQRFQCL